MPLWLKWILGGFGLPLTLLGFGLYLGVSLAIKDANGWTEAEGVVVGRHVEGPIETYWRPGRDQAYRAPPGPHWLVWIDYEYRVEGRTYRSGRISYPLTEGWTSAEQLADFLARHEVGAVVRLRYDPDRPSEATLRVNPVGAPLAFLLFSLFGVPMLLAALFVPRRRAR